MYKLYLKVHRDTRKMYLGYTTKEDINRYPGSGTYWKKHIKKHGNNVKTILLFQTESMDDLKHEGIYYSKKWNILESDRFANLKTEEGVSGSYSKETRKKMSENFNHDAERWPEERRRQQGKMTQERNKKLWADKDHAKKRGENISKSLKGVKRKPRTEEFKKYMSEILTGRSYGAGVKHNLKTVTCPHCDKTGKGPNMSRYHLDKCKNKL